MSTPKTQVNTWKNVFPCNMATSSETELYKNMDKRHTIHENIARQQNRSVYDVPAPKMRSKLYVGEQNKNDIRAYHSAICYSHIVKAFNCAVYGLEIEIDRDNERQQDAKKLYELLEREQGKFLNLVALERDGSLSSQGVEIITAPLSQFELRQRYSAIHNILTQLTKWGWMSHNNHKCGLHISVSRHSEKADDALDKLVMTGEGKTFARLFCRRTDEQLQSYCSFSAGRGSRYRAINWNNDNRLELRLFRGTLKPTTFIASMEYTFALRDFSIKQTENDLPATWLQFKKYLVNNRKRYAVLAKYCLSSEHSQLKDVFYVAPIVPRAPRVHRTKEEREYLKEQKQMERHVSNCKKLKNGQDKMAELIVMAYRSIGRINIRLDPNNPILVNRLLPVTIRSCPSLLKNESSKVTLLVQAQVPSYYKSIDLDYYPGGWGNKGRFTANLSSRSIEITN